MIAAHSDGESLVIRFIASSVLKFQIYETVTKKSNPMVKIRLTMAAKALLLLTAMLVAAILLAARFHAQLKQAKVDRDMYKSSLYASQSEIKTYRASNGRLAASIAAMEIKANDLASVGVKSQQAISQLRVDKKRITSIADISAEYADSLRMHLDSANKQIQSFRYRDSTSSVIGRIVKDTVYLSVTKRIGITAVIHEVPKKFLFIKYGVRERRLELLPSDSTVTITKASLIVIRK